MDDRPPGKRANEHRQQVEADRDEHPSPGDDLKGIAYGLPVGPVPPEERAHPGETEDDEQRTSLRRAREAGDQLHATAAASAGAGSVTRA